MLPFYNVLVKLTVLTIFFVLFYYYVPLKQFRIQHQRSELQHRPNLTLENVFGKNRNLDPIYIWCILVKIRNSDSLLLRKLEIFLQSLIQHSKCRMSLNILTDTKSRSFVQKILDQQIIKDDHQLDEIIFHDIVNASAKIKNITNVMQEHFSSVPGTYYSDSLFYLSLGLYEIAPSHHDKVILLDVDVKFQIGIEHLYEQFQNFATESLFGLAPELSPVYYHILWKWRQTNDNSSFGEPHTTGFPGVNSGVVLMRLDRIRQSKQYASYITESYVTEITQKYMFKGHLGDQDFYTLLTIEQPRLTYLLPCNWNRQLCEWWKYHGYADIFDQFARCDGAVHLYHGNCNTPIPIN